jgi:antitoxin component YwqK of YwqJK toxin-antitoxin module
MKMTFNISSGIALLFFFGCERQSGIALNVPSIFVKSNEKLFETKGGITFFDHHRFSGRQYELYENGDTALLVSFTNGKESGFAKYWYSNRRLKETREYDNGKKVNEHKAWWENGRPKFIYHFKNDEYHGIQKEWFANGQPARMMNYKNGHEAGIQKIWRQDGFLYANYEVKNGRNYGLTGRMHCKNIWKDNE